MNFFKRVVVTEGGGKLLVTLDTDDIGWLRSLDFRRIFISTPDKTCWQQFEEFALLQGFGKMCYHSLIPGATKPFQNNMEDIARNLRRIAACDENKKITNKWPVGRVDIFESDYHNCMIHMPSGELIERSDLAKKFWKYKAYRLFKPVLTFNERIWSYDCDECNVCVKETDYPTHLIEWKIDSSIIKARSIGSMATSFKRIAKMIEQAHGPINRVLLLNLDSFQGLQTPRTFYI